MRDFPECDFPEARRRHLAARARARVLAEHTSAHRAMALERYVEECGVVRWETPAPARTTAI